MPAMTQSRGVGLVAAVVRGNDTLLHRAYGKANVEWDVPMPADAAAIAGASSGMGEAAARHLSAQGATVVPGARRHERLRVGTAECALPDAEAAPLIQEILHIAGRPMRSTPYDYATCTIPRDMKLHFARNAARFLKIRPPAEAVMFFRSTGGLAQNLKLIGARGDFRGVFLVVASLLCAWPSRAPNASPPPAAGSSCRC